MKKAIGIMRLLGLIFLFVGVILNLQMYIYEGWPTYLYLVLCLFGVLLIGLSYLMKPKS
ncbi:hypothetical protein [Flavobacterium degerlachei]|jgi:hypothetical protein|uniref:Uncharacterized protein n=1 Tax=Flavobacterium degerlachei TaxID=229203 RepID=A0A1H3BLL4_9FLAO|nr:hypothetical protein [Flavobacterium degerlachei]SDX42767.1 hypothetical protein SAMN05444338_11054 [Flavobacterium degerlachei]